MNLGFEYNILLSIAVQRILVQFVDTVEFQMIDLDLLTSRETLVPLIFDHSVYFGDQDENFTP